MEGNIASGKTTCLEFFSNSTDIEVRSPHRVRSNLQKLVRVIYRGCRPALSNRNIIRATSASHMWNVKFLIASLKNQREHFIYHNIFQILPHRQVISTKIINVLFCVVFHTKSLKSGMYFIFTAYLTLD